MYSNPFGTLPDGRTASLYTLENNAGMSVTASDFGGIVTNIVVPDRHGKPADVALAHDALESYLENPGSFGALIGRSANRIQNAKLVINGKTYDLPDNAEGHNGHGGPRGLSRRLFHAEMKAIEGFPSLILTITVPDMDDGFPGKLTVTAVYTLTDDNALILDYHAVSDQDTIINLTNHSYFNLAGHDADPIYDHILQLEGDFCAVNLPDAPCLGGIRSIAGTPLDFRVPKRIGDDIEKEYMDKTTAGYNHHYFINGTGYRRFATLIDPGSGRRMDAFTDLPGVQVFTGNHLPTKCVEKNAATYRKHQGIALETHFCPNSTHMPWLQSPICRAGFAYQSTTAYQFSIID